MDLKKYFDTVTGPLDKMLVKVSKSILLTSILGLL